MKRLAVVCAVLVVLAGCGSLTGGGDATDTPEPDAGTVDTPTEIDRTTDPGTDGADSTPTTARQTPATESPTPTATPTRTPAGDLEPVSEMSSLPPGVTAEKVTNATALFAAGNQQFADGGVRYQMHLRNSTGQDAEFSVANDSRVSFTRISAVERGLVQEYYVGETEAGTYNSSIDRVSYGSGPTGLRTSTQLVTALLAVYPQGFATPLEWETAGVDATSGEERLVLTADERNESAATEGLFAPSLVRNGETLQSVSGRLEVTADGLIPQGNVSATVTGSDGAETTRGLEFAIERIDAGSIERPNWLESAPKPTVSLSDDDRLLVYEHAGDRALTAGTNLSVNSVGGFGSSSTDTVALNESVEAGDSVYVYKTGEGTGARAHATVGERPSLPDDATTFAGTVSVSVEVGNYQFELGVEASSTE